MTHYLALTLFAALVAPVFACLMREGTGDRARFAAKAFGTFLAFAYGVGWLMYLLG